MPSLTLEQTRRANEALNALLNAPSREDGRSSMEYWDERDHLRRQAIDDALRPLVMSFLSESLDLADFKARVLALNQRHDHWGFAEEGGGKFLDDYVSSARDKDECVRELRDALAAPTSENGARDKLNRFLSHASRHGAQPGGGESAPDSSTIPFLLSWSWQVQDRDTWPVQFGAVIGGMKRLGVFVAAGDPADDYVVFKQACEELADVFKNRSGRFFGHYEVERVLRSANES